MGTVFLKTMDTSTIWKPVEIFLNCLILWWKNIERRILFKWWPIVILWWEPPLQGFVFAKMKRNWQPTFSCTANRPMVCGLRSFLFLTCLCYCFPNWLEKSFSIRGLFLSVPSTQLFGGWFHYVFFIVHLERVEWKIFWRPRVTLHGTESFFCFFFFLISKCKLNKNTKRGTPKYT